MSPSPGWRVVGGTQGAAILRHSGKSPLRMSANVVDFSRAPGHRATTFEAMPILANATLYFCTLYNRVVALQAETGKLLWSRSRWPRNSRTRNA